MRRFCLYVIAALALLYLFLCQGKERTIPEIIYFYLALSIVAGFLLIGVIARINRRRNSRRIQRGIAEYLLQKTATR